MCWSQNFLANFALGAGVGMWLCIRVYDDTTNRRSAQSFFSHVLNKCGNFQWNGLKSVQMVDLFVLPLKSFPQLHTALKLFLSLLFAVTVLILKHLNQVTLKLIDNNLNRFFLFWVSSVGFRVHILHMPITINDMINNKNNNNNSSRKESNCHRHIWVTSGFLRYNKTTCERVLLLIQLRIL